MAISDIRKSLSSVFEERLTNPFYGSFIISWLIWNWEIVYLTLFISSESIRPLNKIQYITLAYSSLWKLIIYPLISAVLLVVAMPWIANKLFSVFLLYESQKRAEKEKYDSRRRLTIEESAAIRATVFEQDERHQRQITAKDGEIGRLKSQLTVQEESIIHMNRQIEDLSTANRKFKIIYAEYGKDEQFADVTAKTASLLESEINFLVTNEQLDGDPAPGIYKDFIIVYQSEGSTHVAKGAENDRIELREGKLVVNKTEVSTNVANAVNAKKLAKLFSGRWHLLYSGENTGEEEIEINDSGQYYVKNHTTGNMKHIFNLEDMFIDNKAGKVKFTKVGVPPDNRKIENVLTIKEAKQRYEGFEDGGKTIVVYTKIGG